MIFIPKEKRGGRKKNQGQMYGAAQNSQDSMELI